LHGPIAFTEKCVRFAKAMKEVDPSIKIIMGNYYVHHQKFEEMLELAGPYVDIITNRGGDSKQIADDAKILETYNEKHGTDIGIAHTELRAPLDRKIKGADGGLMITESNDEGTFLTRQTYWNYGLNTLNQYIDYQNIGGTFRFANFTNTSDGWGESLINTPKEGTYISSAGRAFQLMQKLDIVQPVKIESNIQDEDIVVQAAWNADSTKFTLLVLNYGNAKTVNFDLTDIRGKFSNTQVNYVVSAPDLKTFNSYNNPENISFQTFKSHFKSKKITVKLIGASATTYEFIKL
jgi:alpha-N-arabinofuranosidase